MINSNKRKLNLSGWLMKNNPKAYASPLKLQKFLLFYELFSEVNGETSDFTNLKGYKKGPVFSTVWGDYTKEKKEFNTQAIKTYQNNKNEINNNNANMSSYLVSILNEIELSDLTHKLNLWNNKESLIKSNIKQVELEKKDFTENDKNLIRTLENMYPIELIKNSIILPINDTNFVFSKEQYSLLTEEHIDILTQIKQNEKLHNPVYVEIDEDGALSID